MIVGREVGRLGDLVVGDEEEVGAVDLEVGVGRGVVEEVLDEEGVLDLVRRRLRDVLRVGVL